MLVHGPVVIVGGLYYVLTIVHGPPKYILIYWFVEKKGRQKHKTLHGSSHVYRQTVNISCIKAYRGLTNITLTSYKSNKRCKFYINIIINN